MTTRRIGFAMFAFIAVLQWSRPAAADATGTVGPLAAGSGNNGANYAWFKFTDGTLTQACTNQNGQTGPAGYAYVFISNQNQPSVNASNQLLALLLVSKKGAPIKCVFQAPDCFVRSCELQ